MAKNNLTEEGIVEILFDPEISEDDYESEDELEGNEIYIPLSQRDLNEILGGANAIELEEDIENIPPGDNIPVPSTSAGIDLGNNRDIIWKKKGLNMPEDQIKFLGKTDLTENVLHLETPYQFFKYFFDDDLMKRIVEETNLYSTQKCVDNPFTITNTDLYKYFGIMILSSIANFPNIRMLWDTIIGPPLVAETMPQKYFKKIRSVFHFNNNDNFACDKLHENYDKLHKLRPIVDRLNSKFATITMEESLSVDEK